MNTLPFYVLRNAITHPCVFANSIEGTQLSELALISVAAYALSYTAVYSMDLKIFAAAISAAATIVSVCKNYVLRSENDSSYSILPYVR